jgi:hypothetical protein
MLPTGYFPRALSRGLSLLPRDGATLLGQSVSRRDRQPGVRRPAGRWRPRQRRVAGDPDNLPRRNPQRRQLALAVPPTRAERALPPKSRLKQLRAARRLVGGVPDQHQAKTVPLPACRSGENSVFDADAGARTSDEP